MFVETMNFIDDLNAIIDRYDGTADSAAEMRAEAVKRRDRLMDQFRKDEAEFFKQFYAERNPIVV